MKIMIETCSKIISTLLLLNVTVIVIIFTIVTYILKIIS